MLLSDFEYPLPKELIAQEGLAERDAARLLVLDSDGSVKHSSIRQLLGFLKKGDLWVVNDTRVLAARMMGKKSSGGKVDCLIVRRPEPGSDPHLFEALLKGSNLKANAILTFEGAGGESVEARILETLRGALHKIRVDRPERIPAVATLPLPPYIKKPLTEPERYQTVYANEPGSLAAPTAGLHFTEPLLEALREKGVETARITLHVGTGTFAPIRAENVEDWKMHAESYRVEEDAAARIQRALGEGRRVFAVGTTTVRALESATDAGGRIRPGSGSTDAYIYPGYRFKVPYAGMLTNFHLPRSTLLLLVCAFAGREKILAAYAKAVKERYRFFSFGDAMLILKRGGPAPG